MHTIIMSGPPPRTSASNRLPPLLDYLFFGRVDVSHCQYDWSPASASCEPTGEEGAKDMHKPCREALMQEGQGLHEGEEGPGSEGAGEGGKDGGRGAGKRGKMVQSRVQSQNFNQSDFKCN